jgi:RNA polymerase sigma-B factor
MEMPPMNHAITDVPLTRTERAERTAALLERLHETTDEAVAAELRAEVVLVNRGVAESVAMRYRGRGVATEDLYQVAYEGLTKAVQRFDFEMRKDLLTFAVPTIRGELQRYFRDLGWTVRPPRRIQELQGRANQTFARLSQELGREPTAEEVADALGISAKDYRDSEAALGCFTPTSLDQPAGQSTATVGDLIVEDDDSHDASEARVMLAPVVRELSARDRRILYLRFFEDRTQSEIGEDLGVTQMQVSRLLSRILGDMRHELEAT